MEDAKEILALAGSYMQSRALLTAAALDVFTALEEKPRSAVQMAEDMNLDRRALERLLDCLTALGFLEKCQGSYRNGTRGSRLSSRHPETALPMLDHLDTIWANWGSLTDTVRTGANPDLKPIITTTSDRERTAFIRAMHVIGRDFSRTIARRYETKRYRCLLDVGSASGTYAIAFLEANPCLKAVLFDFPEVIPLAQEMVEREGLADRVHYCAGDFYHDDLPHGSDLVLLSAIIHQNSTAQNCRLFAKVFRALEPGGCLLIRDHIMNQDRTAPAAGTLFALNMLVNTPGGDTYTFAEVRDALEKEGFRHITLLQTGDHMDCLVEAQKPEHAP